MSANSSESKTRFTHDNITLKTIVPYKHFRTQGKLCAFEWNLASDNSYGGGIATQAVIALFQSFYPQQADFTISTMHCYFVNGAKRSIDVDFIVTILRDGKSSLHREVCGYQNDEIILKVMAYFKRSAPIAKGITLKKGVQPVVEYSLRNFYKHEEHHLHTEYFYDSLNLERDFDVKLNSQFKNKMDAMDAISLFVPKTPGSSLLHVNDHDIHSSDINNRHLLTVVCATKNCKSDLLVSLLSMSTSYPLSMIYKCYLVYISDLYMMASVKFLIGSVPTKKTGFVVSLDHAMYFNDLFIEDPKIEKSKLNIYEPHVMIHELVKGANGQYTIKVSIFNRWDQCMAIVIQEGLTFIENKADKNLEKPSVDGHFKKFVYPTRTDAGTKKFNSKL